MHRLKLLVCALLALLFLACLTLHTAAQDKPAQHKENVILPDPTPPKGWLSPSKGFRVDITSMNVVESAAGPSFTIKGYAGYPDGTFGAVSIKFDERDLPGTNKFFRIRNKRFEVSLSASELWAGKKVFPGNYEVEAQVNPAQQPRTIKVKIKKELGPYARTIEYRNKYVIVGDKEEKKIAEDLLKDHYVDMIETAKKLYTGFDEKYKAAMLKYSSRFRKLDKNGRKQIDPNNSKIYLVDNAEFVKYLRKNPNEFYDDSGTFKEDAWRQWLDCVWHVELEKAFKKHELFKGNYAAIAWPDQYDQMVNVLKMIKKRSGEKSINLYLCTGLPENKKDRKAVGTGEDPNPGVGGTKLVNILKVVKEIRLDLELLKHLKSKIEKPPEKQEKDAKPAPGEKSEPEEKKKEPGNTGSPEK